MSSLIGALDHFSIVIVTGGSSGIGKSFIERAFNVKPGLQFCNLSRHVPDIKITGLKLNHFPCDLSSAAEDEDICPQPRDRSQRSDETQSNGRAR